MTDLFTKAEHTGQQNSSFFFFFILIKKSKWDIYECQAEQRNVQSATQFDDRSPMLGGLASSLKLHDKTHFMVPSLKPPKDKEHTENSSVKPNSYFYVVFPFCSSFF